MSDITKKLKSNSGASMVAALLFFLFCTMVGSVVLTAASVNAGKIRREREAYQSYVSASSAARLISEDLQRLIFRGTWKHVEIVTTTVETETIDGQEVSSTSVERETYDARTDEEDGEKRTGFYGESRLLKKLQSQPVIDISELYYSTIPQLDYRNFMETHDCTFTVSAEHFQTVSGKLSVDGDYRLTVTLWEGDGTQKRNEMTLTFAPELAPVSISTETEEEHESGSSSTKTTITYYTTELVWKQPVITKGGRREAD